MQCPQTAHEQCKGGDDPNRCLILCGRRCKDKEDGRRRQLKTTQQRSTVDPIGNRAGQQAKYEERQEIDRQYDADPSRGPGRLVDQQADHHLLAAHPLLMECGTA